MFHQVFQIRNQQKAVSQCELSTRKVLQVSTYQDRVTSLFEMPGVDSFPLMKGEGRASGKECGISQKQNSVYYANQSSVATKA